MLNRTLGAIGMAAILATGCGTQGQEDRPDAEGRPDGGAYFFERVSFVREVIAPDVMSQPVSLEEALPCNEREGVSASSAVVRGSIVEVRPGDAVVWGDEEDSVSVTTFDDPNADERNVLVEIKVQDSRTAEGVEPLTDTVTARMGVLAGSDPEQFQASLESLGDVVVLLSTRQDGRHRGDFYPILGGAGVGIVDQSTDQLSFPGLSDDVKFLGELTSATEALAHCTK